MTKRLFRYNELADDYKALGPEDRKELKWHIDHNVPLFIDEFNRIYNEAGTYIADVVEQEPIRYED